MVFPIHFQLRVDLAAAFARHGAARVETAAMRKLSQRRRVTLYRLEAVARERGNDFGRQLFLNGNDFQSYVELTVEAGRELNRRVYRRFRSVNDNRAGN